MKSRTSVLALLIMVLMYLAGPARRGGAGTVSQQQSTMAQTQRATLSTRHTKRRTFDALACTPCKDAGEEFSSTLRSKLQ